MQEKPTSLDDLMTIQRFAERYRDFVGGETPQQRVKATRWLIWKYEKELVATGALVGTYKRRRIHVPAFLDWFINRDQNAA